MSKLIRFLFIPALLVMHCIAWAAESAPATLVGANLNTGGLSKGIYTFQATENPEFTPLLTGVEINGGAVYVNGRYYALVYDYDSQQHLTMCRWLTYDAETWQQVAAVDCPLDFSYIAADRTYDASTGKVYSLCYDRTATNLRLVTTELATGAPTLIGELPTDKSMLCITATTGGNLYTLDVNANLYRIDPITAKLTLVGNTNIFDQYETGYTQSMAYDAVSGKIYWTEFHTVGFSGAAGALYAIDPATAATTKVCDLPAKAEITGLYVKEAAATDAPGRVTNLKAVAKESGSSEVCFTFTAPDKTNVGTPLTGGLTVEIIVDSETIDLIDDVEPGQTFTTDYYTIAKGLHNAKVRVENEVGQSENALLAFFVGYDVPAAPSNVKLTSQDNKAVLTWDAPTVGAQGGEIRMPVTYNVVRLADSETVATAFAETTYSEIVPKAALYAYEVIAVSPDGSSPAALSNSLVVSAFDIPFVETFDTTEAGDLFTVIDANGDEKTWSWFADNRCMRYSYAVRNAADDWLITPPIRLEAAKSYSVAFDSYKYLSGYKEIVELWYGTTADPKEMNLLSTVTVPSVDATNSSVVVPALTDGAHFFALHAVSGANQMFIYIDNFSVTEAGSADVPAAVTDLTATACGDDYKDIQLDFTAPDKTLNGLTLNAISRIEILKGASATAVKSFENPAPGESLTWVDEALSQGSYAYTVTVYNGSGASEPATITAYAGIDVPQPVTNVTMNVDNGYPVVEWTAPKAGANGGNMTGLLTYDVVRVYNAVERTVAEGITEAQFSDTDVDADNQAYIYYTVTACSKAGKATGVNSDGVVIGNPHKAPWSESFANKTMQSNPWFVTLLNGNSGGWAISSQEYYPSAKAQDGDGGFAAFDGYHTWSANARLTTPRIALAHLADPSLSFYMYHFHGDSWSGETGPEYVRAQLQLEIAQDGGEVVEMPNGLYELYASTDGWVKHDIDLTPYKDCEYVNISFKGLNGYTYNIYVDNINITGEPSGAEIVETGSLEVSSVNGALVFSGNAGTPVYIYTVDGRLVYTSSCEADAVALASGFYIVKTSTTAVKVRVK